MDLREEFKEILFNAFIADFDDAEQSESVISAIRDWILKNTPKSLFRYRTCKDYCFDALQNDEVWGSSPNSLNDPFEWIPYYDLQKIQDYVNKTYDPVVVLPQIEALKQDNIPNELKAMISPELLEQFIGAIGSIDNEFIQQLLIHGKNIFSELFLKNYEKYQTAFFQEIFLWGRFRHSACFSEDNLSTLMWGHYADSHKGFVVEYDFSEMQGLCEDQCDHKSSCSNFALKLPLAPVIYQKKRFDASAMMIAIATSDWVNEHKLPINILNYDKLLMTKCLLTKSSLWEYEKEWRVLSKTYKNIQELEISDYRCIATIKAKAVYIGAKATAETKERLKQICGSKGIPCYQMVPKYTSENYDLDYTIVD